MAISEPSIGKKCTPFASAQMCALNKLRSKCSCLHSQFYRTSLASMETRTHTHPEIERRLFFRKLYTYNGILIALRMTQIHRYTRNSNLNGKGSESQVTSASQQITIILAVLWMRVRAFNYFVALLGVRFSSQMMPSDESITRNSIEIRFVKCVKLIFTLRWKVRCCNQHPLIAAT